MNEAVRAGLCQPATPVKLPRFVQRSYRLGRPLVNLTKANTLAAKLEDVELDARMQKLRGANA